MSSLASAKGPSTTVRFGPENLMRQPFALAWRPEASSSTPAFCSSSWYWAISANASSSGMTPASESFVAFTMIMNRMGLPPLLRLGCRGAQPFLLLLELGLERVTEVLHLEHLANLHFAIAERGPFQPFDGFVQRLHLPQPEPGDELLRLRERSVDHRPLAAGEPYPHALGALLEPLGGEQHARFLELHVELAHLGQDLLIREHPGFGVLIGFDHHHEAHHFSSWLSINTTGEGRRNRRSTPTRTSLRVPSSPSDPLSLRERG